MLYLVDCDCALPLVHGGDDSNLSEDPVLITLGIGRAHAVHPDTYVGLCNTTVTHVFNTRFWPDIVLTNVACPRCLELTT